MIIRHSIFVTALFVLCAPAISWASDDGLADDDGKRCINARTIRRTDVVNDSNIIFYMQGRKIFLNNLPKTCRGLSRERRFSYVTHTRSLCEFDAIRVLKDSGFGAYEGRACKLGRFRAASQEDIADFYEQLGNKPKAEKVQPPPVEDVVSDEVEDADTR